MPVILPQGTEPEGTTQSEINEVLSYLEGCHSVMDEMLGNDQKRIGVEPAVRPVQSACSAARISAQTLEQRLRELRSQLGQFA